MSKSNDFRRLKTEQTKEKKVEAMRLYIFYLNNGGGKILIQASSKDAALELFLEQEGRSRYDIKRVKKAG